MNSKSRGNLRASHIEQLHVLFILHFWVLLFFFLYSIYVTLNYEPEFSLNRTVTVTTYICFHYVRAETFEAVHTKVIQWLTPDQNLMKIFYRPVYRKGDKEPGKHSRVCSCHFSDGKKSNGSEMFERVCRKYWLKQPDGAFIITPLWPLPHWKQNYDEWHLTTIYRSLL